ncbi:DUF5381 family protein [Metabacillus indicus]|uniref:DUF5381 family protein n=1 Tax=Metabacillus indicus TaxID=246786 RepID=UPI0031716579
MLNLTTNQNIVHIKGSKFMYVWMLLATFGGLAACVFLIANGLKFDSKYSLFYLGGGILLSPVFLYLTLWSLPGFVPGKVLLSLTEGPNGSVKSKNKNIPFTSIKNIRFVRNPLNLINDIVIETYDGKITKIRTYNQLDDTDFAVLVDQYIYPHMNQDAKTVWDRHVNLDQLFEDAKYERKAE